MNVRDLSMKMDYQLPPQTLQLASNAVVGSLMNSNGNNNALSQQQQQLNQQQNAQLQLLQLNHQQQQQQQQQQLVNNQQQQQLLNHMTSGQQTLPSLSSLPLQVVNQLPHLLANNGVTLNNNNSSNNNNNNNTNINNLNILNNNLNNNSSALNNNNNNSNNSTVNTNLTSNNNNNSNSTNNVLLRNTMQHVANANQQLQQTINSLSNNLVSSLPPSTQLLQHHLQHLANVNNAVVQLNNNNNTSSNNNSNSSSPSNNSANNNMLLNNNNNNPSTPNNNLATHLSDNVVAHNIVNGLVGVLNNVNNNNNSNNNNNNNSNTNLNNNILNNGGNQNSAASNLEDNSRWTQFQVQQLWKQHASYLNGRKSPFLGFICKTNGKSTSNSKEVICPDDKYKEEGDLWNVEAQTAFLGPNLWEKTLPYDADLKYADLDEFLSENNIPDGLPGTHLGHSSSLGHRSDSLSHAAGLSLGLGHITTKRERSPSPSDCISPDTLNPPSPAESTFSFASSGRDFDPRTRAFSDEELKPQPMIKKSRKQFVPDELKDDKYWARRRKNNIAAKRSRDARRQKENQIAMRARYLEKENATLHQEVEQLKQENMDLRARLSKFQDV
ncbi:putative uncharacterized protein DDB_G0286901 isoform X7 [Calliphora vicina]|uniref:putative uncharacterized protein DDB_G0286901 isoform X7 n=1 Tax=Calliphora vicina TaxID=7373 RepID=UPI00325B1D6D